MSRENAPPLDEAALDPDPLRQLAAWLDEARAAGIHEPEAMTLATATPDGVPSARMVLLRGLSEEGLAFYTNYSSRKGRELAANPRAAVVLYWDALGRQVRVEGRVRRTTVRESLSYWVTRPPGSRASAWASRQSEVLGSRRELVERAARIEERWPGGTAPLPPFWGGFVLRPSAVEFWQAGDDRLHDRVRYLPEGEGWRIERLSP